MLDIYLCEDVVAQKQIMEDIINDIIKKEGFDMHIVSSAVSPSELIDVLKVNKGRGIYFIDLNLGDGPHGLDLAKEIRKYDPRGYIVIVTSHAELAPLTYLYKVEIFDYVMKEKFVGFEAKIKSCLLSIIDRESLDTTNSDARNKTFVYKQKGWVICEKMDNIISFELFGSEHSVVLSSTERQVQFFSTLKEVEKHLDGRFFRCSDNVIINKDKIVEIHKNKRLISMENGEQFSASVRKLRELL